MKFKCTFKCRRAASTGRWYWGALTSTPLAGQWPLPHCALLRLHRAPFAPFWAQIHFSPRDLCPSVHVRLEKKLITLLFPDGRAFTLKVNPWVRVGNRRGLEARRIEKSRQQLGRRSQPHLKAAYREDCSVYQYMSG